jgi:hypothetical protein
MVQADRLPAAVASLAFATSHRLFVMWYARGRSPSTFEDVRTRLQTTYPVQAVLGAHDRVRDGEVSDSDRIQQLLAEWESVALSSDRPSGD